MFNNTFYPTPETIANKMLEGIDFTFIQTVLEPSAGTTKSCSQSSTA